MVVPKNEGRVCDAVVRTLEKWTREPRSDVRHPEKEGGGPPVDLRLKLGSQEYAIEHTRIESVGNQITTEFVARRITEYIKKISRSHFQARPTTNCNSRSTFPCPKAESKENEHLVLS